MTQTMNDNRASIFGTIVSGCFAGLSHVLAHFEAHASSYAAFAAVVASIFTIANIIHGWIKRKE